MRPCVAPRHQQGGRTTRQAVPPCSSMGIGSPCLPALVGARVADALAVSWNAVNNAVLAEGQRVLIADPARFDGVAVIGVDEHVWRHTHRGDKYVIVIIDLTPVRDKTGPARLLDMVEGRSKKAFADWLADRPQQWRDGVEVIAMDGFSGFKTAVTEELPDAVTVMDLFHVVCLAGNALDECQRSVQLATRGHRGRKTDPPTPAGAPCRPVPTCSPTSRDQWSGG